VAAGVSFPLSQVIGWRTVLGVWALPAVVALAVWLPQLKSGPSPAAPRASGSRSGRVWRSPLAWQIAAFFGLQSMTYYVLLAWLPALLQCRGTSPAAAGWLLALSQATGIVGSAIVPAMACRFRDQRGTVALLGLLEGVGLVGLLIPGLAGLT